MKKPSAALEWGLLARKAMPWLEAENIQLHSPISGWKVGRVENELIANGQGLPRWSCGSDSAFLMQGAQVPFLPRELDPPCHN